MPAHCAIPVRKKINPLLIDSYAPRKLHMTEGLPVSETLDKLVHFFVHTCMSDLKSQY